MPVNYSSYYINTTLPNNCNHSFTQFGYYDGYSYSSPADDLLYQIRKTLFTTSVLVGAYPYSYNSTQNVADIRLWESVTVYSMAWKYWGATVLVTICVLLFILPTYYGFWTLKRKTTLSPFETARAFHAPVLADAPVHLDTRDLLKKVGSTHLHNHTGAQQATGLWKGLDSTFSLCYESCRWTIGSVSRRLAGDPKARRIM